MEPAIPVMAVIGAIAASVIVVRFATAFAKRLERRPPTVSPTDPAIGELRDALDAMQERLDFLERALVAQRNQSGRALPAAGGGAGPPGGTPLLGLLWPTKPRKRAGGGRLKGQGALCPCGEELFG